LGFPKHRRCSPGWLLELPHLPTLAQRPAGDAPRTLPRTQVRNLLKWNTESKDPLLQASPLAKQACLGCLGCPVPPPIATCAFFKRGCQGIHTPATLHLNSSSLHVSI
uniref:Uncharacterized protein n=1 Tax=Felis catus TaxID=9685 RepID=A0ABI8AGJ9_FELCA